MNKKKISVLEKAIQMLENGFKYNWEMTESCNCGVVACAVTKKKWSYNAIRKDATFNRSIWSEAIANTADNKCNITGLKIGRVQKALLGAGFGKHDLLQLEYLSNSDILARCCIDNENGDYWRRKSNLLRYLRAWIEILKEEDEKEIRAQSDKEADKLRQSFPSKIEIHYSVVKVDNSISEQAKELIMQ